MSLRSYLFSLIGSLIILLTASQLTLVYWIDKNLAEEVEIQARYLSRQVFELAFDEIDNIDQHKKVLQHKVIKTNRRLENRVFEQNIEVIELAPTKTAQHLEILKELKKTNKHFLIF